MNKNIDLTKILEDCPRGFELYSSIYGTVTFEGIDYNNSDYPICVKTPTLTATFTKEGRYFFTCSDSECCLFPSHEQRDWSKFIAPWYKKEKLVELKESDDEKIREAILNGLIDCRDAPDLGWSNFGGIHIDDCIAWLENQGEKNLSSANDRAWLYLVSDVLTWKCGIGQYLDNPRVQELAKRLCSEYAQKLYNPSVLLNSSNTRKYERKFDPRTLKPFDKVLARDGGSGYWSCQLFSYIVEDEVECPYSCVSNFYNQCIPYNDDTKHLVGTTEEAPEYYRYWED